MPFSRLWLLALTILLPSPLYCGSLPFNQALELALTRSGSGQAVPGGRSVAGHTTERSCPVHLQDYSQIASQIASQFASANTLGLSAGSPAFSLAGPESSESAIDLRSRKNVILCTALIYTRLEGLAAQRQLLNQQQEFVTRLMDIESRRVHVDVDNPVALTQAKLLRAAIRLESATLTASERKTRATLSALLVLPASQLDQLDQVGPADQIDPVPGSMPALPDRFTTTAEDGEALQQLMACRDLVQLDYVVEYAHRLRVTQDMVLAKASIGSLVAAHVTEGIKFLALLQLGEKIREAKLQFLGATGDLENWASGSAIRVAARPSDASGRDVPTLLSILISPAIKELEVARSQQFSATATYSDGRARDVTAEAAWGCSCDTVAVLSTTGLLTGLSVSPASVEVEFQGLKGSRRVSLIEQPIDEYLMPNR